MFKIEIANFVINIVAASGLASLVASVYGNTAMFRCVLGYLHSNC